MKVRYIFVFAVILFSLIQINTNAQSLGLGWKCEYATWDEQPNSTGYNVISTGAIKENTFVALVWRASTTVKTSYLVGYTNADSGKGRMGSYLYGSAIAGYKTAWSQGFDEVLMTDAYDIATTPDSLIYVANNDAERNILVFKLGKDTIETTDYRTITNSKGLWAIDVDGSGRVYTTEAGDTVTAGKVFVYNSIKADPIWGDMHNSTPLQTITLPDAGELRGITVNAAGTIIYVSNYTNKKVYCYVGSPTSGYTLYTGFNFVFSETKLASDGTTILTPAPWGLKFLNQKNLLFVATSVSFKTGTGYEYGKIYILNPNTGAVLDTIDCAKWNHDMTGSYSSRSGGTTPGNVSGYTSVYNVDFDSNFKLYSQSYYGWTVDKWAYNGTLPVIPLTISSVQKIESVVPTGFSLSQNYPNPFNPSTNIEFSLNEESDISLAVYSVTGELVTELIKNANFAKGVYKVSFDASKMASGTYIYTLKNKSNQISKKMTFIK